MTTDPATAARSLPLVRRPLRPDLRREIRWWLLLAVMALVDAIGFWIILTLVLPQAALPLLWAVVLGSALVSVVLPHTAGAIMRERHEGHPGSLAGVFVCFVVWAGLGAIMAWTRLTTAPPGDVPDLAPGTGLLPGDPTEQTSDPGLVVAGLLLMLYVATAVVAFRHAWMRSSPADLEERELVAAYERIRRQVSAEEYELAVADRRAERARQDAATLAGRRELHYELNEAVAEVVTEELTRETARRLGDPAANDALARTPHRRPPRWPDGDPRDPRDPRGRGDVIDLPAAEQDGAPTTDHPAHEDGPR